MVDWRRPPYPVRTADYATYVQILTWFLDTPSPEAPFSVHRMALAGKELGKDVGQWFGPSTAAGAIKYVELLVDFRFFPLMCDFLRRTLVQAFPEAGLGVSVAVDGTLYQTDVFLASHSSTRRRYAPGKGPTTWGDQPVLCLLGVRLGIEGVNPIYYDTIKVGSAYTLSETPSLISLSSCCIHSHNPLVSQAADQARPTTSSAPNPTISSTSIRTTLGLQSLSDFHRASEIPTPQIQVGNGTPLDQAVTGRRRITKIGGTETRVARLLAAAATAHARQHPPPPSELALQHSRRSRTMLLHHLLPYSKTSQPRLHPPRRRLAPTPQLIIATPALRHLV